jgi:aryl-alcohol dehydrogenase-like predicted oxidoreductase
MDYRPLGSSGLQVSTLTLGTMTFGGRGNFANVGDTDLDGARRQIDMCLDAGVNLIDTADVYSTGRSEEIVGEVLKGRRDDVLGCEASLRRLGTDYIDIYHVHEWDGLTPLEETLGALQYLVDTGKVRYVAVSNYTGWQLMKALGIAERDHLPRFAAQQIYYSLQERSAEYELIPLAVDQGLGTFVWSPLAGGLLSGKYRRGQDAPAGSRHLTDWDEPPVYDEDRLHDTVDVLVQVADGHGVSAAQVALAWLLRRPTVSSVIIGARTDEQLADNLRAAELTLSEEEAGRLEEVSRPPLLYPYWHQRKTAAERLGQADLALLGPYLA